MTEPNNFDSPMKSLGSVSAGLMHDINSAAAGVDPIKGHPGRSRDILRFGLPRFEAHVARVTDTFAITDEARASIDAEFAKGEALCESPIERNLLAALITGDWPACRALHPAVHDAKNYDEPFPRCEVVIVPQMMMLRYRLDLGLVVGRLDAKPLLIGIECDGKQFHQDAQKDRERDAYFFALGVRVIRIGGAALNQHPIAIADALIDQVGEWLAA